MESAPSIFIRNLSSATPTEWVATKTVADETSMFLQLICGHRQHHDAAFNPTAEEVTSPNSDDNDDTERDSVIPRPIMLDTESTLGVQSPVRATSTRRERPRFTSPVPLGYKSEGGQVKSESESEITALFSKALKSNPRLWKDIQKSLKGTAFLKMEDAGGQPKFMDMLPALTIGPALYLLFCKLIDDLKSSYTVSYLSPVSGESTTPEKSTYTVEEVLLTALASISCFKSYSNLPQISSEQTATSSNVEELLSSSVESLAYIVGTHKDKVQSEEQIDEFDKKLQQSIRSTDFFREGLVKFSSEHRMVLPIDNMYGGVDEIQKVRKFLEEGMKQHFKKLRIPAAWLVLSLCLRMREERTASLQSVLQLAGDLGIPQQETKVALWFLHHYAGVLMYFPKLEELKDTVICDTQIVYDSATYLIVNTFKFGQVSMAALEEFRYRGKFSLEDIRRVTATVLGDYISLEKLVKLLEHLNIIAPIIQSNPTPSQATSPQSPEVTYFMPCVLQNATHEELDQWWASASDPLSPAPLFIRYKCGYVPIGVFPAMIASLAGNGSLEMNYDCIKKNRVQFLFGCDCDTVTLISHPKYYAIHISRRPDPKTPTHEVCNRIRVLVESTLKTVTSHMNYSFHVEYQLAFECPSHPGREHLCVVKSEETSPRFMYCLANLKAKFPVEMQNQHLIWLKEVAMDW